MEDQELLREYARTGSESAFSALARQYIDLVYSAALRQAGNPHLAEEATQTVFVRLAQKAGSLPSGVILAGWLYRAARFAAADVVRSENRRRHWEQQAMETFSEHPTDSPWEQVAPFLDDALATLNEADRNAILLRFFQRKSLSEVGRAFGTNEDAAQKRVTRAVDKLRAFFTRRGQVISSAALAGALATGAVEAAPAALLTSVTAAALGASAIGASTATSGLLKFMAWTQLKTVAVAAGAVVAGVTLYHEAAQLSALRREKLQLAAELQRLQRSDTGEAARLAALQDELERSQRDAADVHRLRGEVAQLRRDQALAAQVATAYAKLKEQVAKHDPKAGADTDEETDPAKEAEKQTFIAKMNFTRNWLLAIMTYTDKTKGTVPADYAAVAAYLPEDARGVAAPDQYEVVYTGALADLAHPEKTIVLQEKAPVQTISGRWARSYGFADGHSEIHTADQADGFQAWAQERTVTAPAPTLGQLSPPQP